ncbi:MAG: hypothetical protein ABSH46_11120 [Bryobacteraceae bacterium]|jgi:predicted SprT family Zn-dependent metalloprotease
MPDDRSSLLAGRNRAPLNQDEIRRAVNTFLGLDNGVNVRHDPTSRTAFCVRRDTGGTTYGEIVFGADIYPGSSVVDPNSALSLDAAAAHELTHYHRWKDKTSVSDEDLEHVDEALTSLLAIFRYDRHLSEADIHQLVADAIQRLQLFIAKQDEPGDIGEQE